MNRRLNISFFSLLIALMAVMAGVSSCGNDVDAPYTSNPFLGTWTLYSVNDVVVSAQSVDRYTFTDNVDDPTSDIGQGQYATYDATNDQWQSTPIEWEIISANEMKITGQRGGGSFVYQVSRQSNVATLKLFEPSISTMRTYHKYL